MITHKSIDRICCLCLAATLVLTLLFINGESLGMKKAVQVLGYETKLFDTTSVHHIDIVMNDWEEFISTCENEEYVSCSIIIDSESYSNVGLRAKGNTSLTQVAAYGNNRYSFKVEFDQYETGKTYHGLDKLSLNNIIQDNTYMKDYLCYQMMGAFGVASPLCSYAYITVNGEDFGLYLAVEGVEDSFLYRNYGAENGNLYKPDSQSFGGGRGNGGAFDLENWQQDGQNIPFQGTVPSPPDKVDPPDNFSSNEEASPGKAGGSPDFSGQPAQAPPDMSTEWSERTPGGFPGGSMGSSDTSLIYTDDNYSSYKNIFDNAKTDITDGDRDRLISSLKNLNQNTAIDQTVDVDQVIRYFVVHGFVCNFDSYTGSMIHNYYLYEDNGQLSMIPWDYNLAFGGFTGAEDATALVNHPIDTPVSGGTIASRPMLAWIFNSDEYLQLYHQYYSEFIETHISLFLHEIERIEALISPYVQKDPTKFCTYDEFETGINTLKEFCQLRAESIQGQLDGTIPSTTDGQAQNATPLIDASTIDISAMGTMGSMGDGPGQSLSPQVPDLQNGQSPETSTIPPTDNTQPPENWDPAFSDGQKTADPSPDNRNGQALPPFISNRPFNG